MKCATLLAGAFAIDAAPLSPGRPHSHFFDHEMTRLTHGIYHDNQFAHPAGEIESKRPFTNWASQGLIDGKGNLKISPDAFPEPTDGCPVSCIFDGKALHVQHYTPSKGTGATRWVPQWQDGMSSDYVHTDRVKHQCYHRGPNAGKPKFGTRVCSCTCARWVNTPFVPDTPCDTSCGVREYQQSATRTTQCFFRDTPLHPPVTVDIPAFMSGVTNSQCSTPDMPRLTGHV
jgi:hypothetical protein